MGEGKGRRRRLICCGIGCLSLLAVWPASAAGPDYEAAWQACKRDTLNQLKAPATARFDNISLAPGKAPAVSVSFSVDSENSYGALLRSWVVCSHDPSTGKTAAVILDGLKEAVLADAADPNRHHRPPE